MSIVLGCIWVVFVALWHSAALPVPGLIGVPADLLVLVVLMWSYVRSAEQAIVMAVVAGATIDLMSGHAIGLTALALLPAAVLGSMRGARLLDTEWLSSILLVAVATCLYHVLLLSMLQLSGDGPPFGTIWKEMFTATLLNALLTPPLYLFLWIVSFDVRPSRRQIRTS